MYDWGLKHIPFLWLLLLRHLRSPLLRNRHSLYYHHHRYRPCPAFAATLVIASLATVTSAVTAAVRIVHYIAIAPSA